jgi:hypothetical protein
MTGRTGNATARTSDATARTSDATAADAARAGDTAAAGATHTRRASMTGSARDGTVTARAAHGVDLRGVTSSGVEPEGLLLHPTGWKEKQDERQQ